MPVLGALRAIGQKTPGVCYDARRLCSSPRAGPTRCCHQVDSYGIVNDPNNLDDPQYIVRLIGQVITVSLETVTLVKGLPELA
jgi:hypothetical protein